MKAFQLIQQKELPGERATLFLYEHNKTKAQVLYMQNEDTNKVFTIGFRTNPIGSTGNCHILEHAVLNGSRKYKTKEPFMDLIKTSLQTFLNAMTYSDRTLYPVASMNDEDFENLMDLYLDAVFFPKAVDDPLIFRQEGWRREIFDPNDPITYQGVVYNEMRGAMSSADDQVDEQIKQNLFADTIYAENSGGNPYDIPTLTYEDFRNYHKENYHPSNSRTFLYGKLDIEKALNHLDEYFSEFEFKETDTLPKWQNVLTKPVKKTLDYSIAQSEDPTKKAYVSLSFLTGPATNDETAYLRRLLAEILINSDAADLRNALLSELGCEAVDVRISNYVQTGFSIICKHMHKEDADKVEDIVFRELKKIATGKSDPKLLEAALRQLEYDVREKGNYGTPGIIFSLRTFGDWNFDLDPMETLDVSKYLERLKEELKNGLLERYLEQYFLNSQQRVLLVHNPVPGLNRKRDEAVKDELREYKACLTEEELSALIERNQKLRKRQNTKNTPEERKTIPSLPLSALPDSPVEIPRELLEEQKYTWLFHDLATAGIQYVDIVFDMAHIALEDLGYVHLICSLLGRLDTQKRSYADLANETRLTTGSLTTTPRIFVNQKDPDTFTKTIVVSMKFLEMERLEEGLDLCYEELFLTDFSNKKRIREVLAEMLTQMKSDIVYSGNKIAADRALALRRKSSFYQDRLDGISFLSFLEKTVKEFTDERLQKLTAIHKDLFTAPKKIINITAEKKDHAELKRIIEEKLAAYPEEQQKEAHFSFTPQKRSEAYHTATDVAFVAMGNTLDDYTGELSVLANVLSMEYLYNEIRAKGGAYGAGISISGSKALATYSYMDPHIKRTVDVYNDLPKQVSELDLSDDELKGFIISSVSGLITPYSARTKGMVDLSDYLTGRDKAFYQSVLDEMKHVTVEKLQSYHTVIQDALNDASLVVLGREDAIEENIELFDSIKEL